MPMTKLLSTVLFISLGALTGCGDDTGGAGGSGQGGGDDAGSTTASGSTGSGECESSGGGEASVGPCLVAAHAGTFSVTPSVGTHARGTITIGADGSIDYDTSLQFEIADYQGVYDRLECCQRISVEMNPRPDNDPALAEGARHRVDVFTDASTPGGAVVRFEYFPNWPSEEGKVILDVTG